MPDPRRHAQALTGFDPKRPSTLAGIRLVGSALEAAGQDLDDGTTGEPATSGLFREKVHLRRVIKGPRSR